MRWSNWNALSLDAIAYVVMFVLIVLAAGVWRVLGL